MAPFLYLYYCFLNGFHFEKFPIIIFIFKRNIIS